MNQRPLIEACVDSVDSARAAERAGANRLELCGSLIEGGCTPSLGLIESVLDQTNISVMVMIRPRGGDFYLSDSEFRVMCRDVMRARDCGVDGFVFGLLTLDGDVDAPRTRELIELARPRSCTFHRAFDMARDPYSAQEVLIELGIDRILTSGQQRTADEGRDCLRELNRRSLNRIQIMAGGGIRPDHVRGLVDFTGIRELHVNGTATTDSPMRYRRTGISLGGLAPNHEFTTGSEDSDRIRECISRFD